MRCVFFGSPHFATASLEHLIHSNHVVVGVVTQPDRPSGRGLKLEPPAVKVLAEKSNLPIWQPEKVNSEETYSWLKKLSPDILVVVAYGEFLGERLLNFCNHPPVNVHPSLLPDLRGAAPMQWAVLNGYSSTGVSTQYMSKKMDAGDVLLQTTIALDQNETSGELQERLRIIGAELLINTLDQIEQKKIIPKPQDHSKATLAPLLKKEMGDIPWSQLNAKEIHNLIRGLSPWPGAYSFLEGKRVKFHRSKLTQSNLPLGSDAPGSIQMHGDQMFVACKNADWIEILSLQWEGKKPALPRDFTNGMKGQGRTPTPRFSTAEG